jgi:hypothetical protein
MTSLVTFVQTNSRGSHDDAVPRLGPFFQFPPARIELRWLPRLLMPPRDNSLQSFGYSNHIDGPVR